MVNAPPPHSEHRCANQSQANKALPHGLACPWRHPTKQSRYCELLTHCLLSFGIHGLASSRIGDINMSQDSHGSFRLAALMGRHSFSLNTPVTRQAPPQCF